MKQSGIHHLTLVVRDQQKAVQFYQTILGYTPSGVQDSWLRPEGDGPMLHLIEIDDAELPAAEDMFHYYNHLAFEAPSLRNSLKSALSLGATVFQMDHQGEEHSVADENDSLEFGLKTLFVRDPDNNLIELVQRGFSWDELFK